MYTGNFGPVSNRADWYERISITEDGGTPPDVSEIALSFGGGKVAKVTKTLTGGDITYDESEGYFEFTIDDADLRNFCPGSYPMGIVITINDAEEQLFAGTLDVIDGVVP